jgi:uncharacterized DUF497 family protein
MYVWDEQKNQTNLEKRGISFENASRVFLARLANKKKRGLS